MMMNDLIISGSISGGAEIGGSQFRPTALAGGRVMAVLRPSGGNGAEMDSCSPVSRGVGNWQGFLQHWSATPTPPPPTFTGRLGLRLHVLIDHVEAPVDRKSDSQHTSLCLSKGVLKTKTNNVRGLTRRM